jgi:hypothetical protein
MGSGTNAVPEAGAPMRSRNGFRNDRRAGEVGCGWVQERTARTGDRLMGCFTPDLLPASFVCEMRAASRRGIRAPVTRGMVRAE